MASDKFFPKLNAIKKDPTLGSILTKMVESPARARGAGKPGEARAPSDILLRKISSITSSNVTDSKNIFQLLPDMELAAQILVSSILSPKDMVTTEINYKLTPGVFDSTLGSALLQVISSFFDSDYKIENLLPVMLEDMLFHKGSYPMVILPESSIDYAINQSTRVSLESLTDQIDSNGDIRHVGLLGPATKPKAKGGLGLESLTSIAALQYQSTKQYDGKICADLTVTDNPNILKVPMLRDKLTQDRIQDVLSLRSISMEARRGEVKMTASEERKVETSLFMRRHYKYTPAMPILTPQQLGRESVGHPLAMKLPAEAVIPVHVPSNPEEHIGYFVLLDIHGNPVANAFRSDYYNDFSNNLAMNQTSVNAMMATQFPNGAGRFSTDKQMEAQEAAQVYMDIVEADLLNRLKNGVYGNNVEIARPQEVYRIMMARACARMQTQLLYIPIDLMTYFAFDYNDYGVGTSLLDQTKILGSIRSMMLFANTMAGIKNSVGRVGLKIQLDPNDPDPSGTIEQLVHQYALNRQAGYPIGASNPLDMLDFLQRAAIDLQVEGNPRYPSTTMDVEDKSSNRVAVDTALEESLKKRHIQSFGLSPETVDLGMNVDFATSVVQSNVLLAKRALKYQKIFTAFLADFMRKYTINSSILMNELREVVKANKGKIPKDITDQIKGTDDDTGVVDVTIMRFLAVLEVGLPSPDSVTLENQVTALNTYIAALDLALAAYISSDFVDGTVLGEIGDNIDTVIAAIRSFFIRKWMQENNMLPELSSLTTKDERNKPSMLLLKEHGDHIENLAKSIESYLLKLRDAKKKRDERVGELGGDGGSEFGSSSFNSSGADNTDGQDDLLDDGLLGDIGSSTNTETTDDNSEVIDVEETEESSSKKTTKTDELNDGIPDLPEE